MNRLRVVLAALLVFTLIGFVSCKKEEAKTDEKPAVEAEKKEEAPAAVEEKKAEVEEAKIDDPAIKDYVALLDKILAAYDENDCAKSVEGLKAIPKADVDKAVAAAKAAEEAGAEPSEADTEILKDRMVKLVGSMSTCMEFYTEAANLLGMSEE
ncbi:MAG: hypothetical protein WC966_05615 [Bradymonadales bacterium]|jgi:hypothetical protein